jgi:tetratricopeptide (TPR) repeat protein
LKGRKFDRATDRRQARAYYGKALAIDPGHAASLRATAVMDFEAGLYDDARQRLDAALLRDPEDGLACYYRGLCALRLGSADDAMQWGYRAVRCGNADALGYDLVGRAQMQRGATYPALAAFERATQLNRELVMVQDHVLLAQCTTGRLANALRLAERRLQDEPSALIPAAVLALENDEALAQFVTNARTSLGDVDFQILDLSLTLAEFGLYAEAKRIVKAVCVDAVPAEQRSFAPLYYLAWLDAQLADKEATALWLQQAAATRKDRVFASRAEELPVWRYAVDQQPQDAQACLQLGCLLANLGRIGEAMPLWQEAADLGAGSIAWRNLGLVAAGDGDVARAESCFRQAIAARPDDQTLYRDLAEILIADQRRAAAIELLESMPPQPHRRAELTVILAESYVAEKRYDDCIQLLESLPYFVNWEGQDVTWRLFNQAHLERGRQRLEAGDAAAALTDFDAALTYPANLNVGRSDKPIEAPAQYWRGQALSALGQPDAARAAWQAGADGADVEGVQNEYRAKCREALGG